MWIIAGLKREGKKLLGHVTADWVIVAIVLLASSASFGLGYLAGKDAGQKDELTIEQLEPGVGEAAMAAGGQYVASKTGKSYHLPWCSGAKLIKEENKVWFTTKEEAEARGYTPAGNCPGI